MRSFLDFVKTGIALIVVVSSLWVVACSSPGERSESTDAVSCAARILEVDETLGQARNHDPQAMPLSTAIRRYTDQLERLETGGCPDAFISAVDAHRQAWTDMLEVTDRYPDLRGEMHDLFDRIDQGADSSRYRELLQAVWDTWEIVEDEATAYLPTRQDSLTDLELMLPDNIDHLVYVVPDLQQGMDTIEQLLGVRPVMGGRHPSYGTHNALLAIGPSTYLEIVARDKTLQMPTRGSLFGTDLVARPHLVTWVVRTDSMPAVVENASQSGVDIGKISSGKRETPDGTILNWQLTDPYAMPLNGAVPFLINWGNTPHPTTSAPQAGRLVGLRVNHPQHEEVRTALEILHVAIPVACDPEYALIAVIQTDHGLIELR